MNILGRLERGVTAVIGVGIVAIGMFVCGAVAAFVLSPQAALDWRHIQSLPTLDAAAYANLSAGSEAVITGTLQDNAELTPDGLVAYQKDRWDVKQPSSSGSDSTPSPQGTWTSIETNVPALSVAAQGGTVKTVLASSVTFDGKQHTYLQRGSSALAADYDGQNLPDQSIRFQGFANGDLVTLVGHKASTGDLIPERLFGGDRVQLVDSIRASAQGLFTGGIAAMICAPIVFVIGLLGVIFGRRRGLFARGGLLG